MKCPWTRYPGFDIEQPSAQSVQQRRRPSPMTAVVFITYSYEDVAGIK